MRASIRIALLTVLLCCLFTGVAAAQEAIPLAFKFSPGAVLEYDVSLAGSGGLRAPDQSFSPAGLQGSMRFRITVAAVNPDGTARVQLLLPRADIQVNVAQEQARFSYENGRMRWFANNREQTPPDTNISQAPLLGVPLEVILAPNGKLVDVILPSLAELPQVQQMIPGFTKPQFQHMGEPMFPDTPVKVGETWRHATQVSPFGALIPPVTVTSVRTLDSITNEGGMSLAKISGSGETRFRMDARPFSPGGAEMKVGIPDLRQTLTSTEFFDITAGKLVRGDYDLGFTTRVSVSAAGQSQEAGLEARFHTTIQAR